MPIDIEKYRLKPKTAGTPAGGINIEKYRIDKPVAEASTPAPVREPQAGSISAGGSTIKSKLMAPVNFAIGAVKGAGDTLATVPRKVSEIFEITGKKAISRSVQAGVQELSRTGKMLSDRFMELPEGDPRREQLRQAIIDNQKTVAQLTGNAPTMETVTEGTDKVLSFLKPKGTAQNIGYGAEKIAEFLVPAGALDKTQKVITKGGEGLSAARAAGELNLAGRVAEKVSRPFTALRTAEKAGELNVAGKALKGTMELGLRSATEGATAAVVTAAQGGDPDDIKTAGLVGAAFPVAGKILSTAAKPFKMAGKALGQKIQETVIRPSLRDFKDGFKISNINRYGLGGSLEETVAKSHTKLNRLSKQLTQALENSSERGAEVNLNNVVQRTKDRLIKNRARNFGNNNQMSKVFSNMIDDLSLTTKGRSVVDLVDATNIKRGAGTKGAWSYGMAEPDAKAVEKVYTTFYQEIRKEIEKVSPDAVKLINKQISDIIPISNAALRRLPVAQRNNVLSLTDTIGLYSAVFDPKALALIGANRLSKSGKFGQFLVRAAERKSSTPVGRLLFGK